MYRRVFRSFCTQSDTIGPPDPRSLLRPIRLVQRHGETPVERKYRLLRQEVQDWNNEFWTAHNTTFHRERGEFITEKLKKEPGKIRVGADEMSIFYKSFLDRNRKTHIGYNIEWYQKNIKLLYMAFEVFVERMLRKLKK